MHESSQGERCLWPVEGNGLGQCGKQTVGEAAALNPLFTPTSLIPVCQEHLDESHRGGAGTDIE